MYGDRAFQDPLLLSREVIKKAFLEGLFYISSEKNIERILKNKKLDNRTYYVFAGVPSFQEVCIDSSPNEKICALKVNLPYEELADFTYDNEEKVLIKDHVSFENVTFEKNMLKLCYENSHLSYVPLLDGEDAKSNLSEVSSLEILKVFAKEIKNYQYAILNKIEFLRQVWDEFFRSQSSKAILDDMTILNDIKSSYEELVLPNNLTR